MDPNANLAEQEQLLSIAADITDPPYRRRTDGTLERRDRHIDRRLADLREALAEWLANGGFAPDWQAQPTAAKYYDH